MQCIVIIVTYTVHLCTTLVILWTCYTGKEALCVVVYAICVFHALLIQDSLSENQWKEAEEAAASAKVREVRLGFDVNSRQRSRAIQSISNGLAKNKFIRRIVLYFVPEEMKESVKQTLKTVTEVYLAD